MNAAATALEIGETRDSGTLRIHRFRCNVVIWDIANAGKRGKKVRKASFSLAKAASYQEESEWTGRISFALAQYASFDCALAYISDLIVSFPDEIHVFQTELRGIDVPTSGFEKQTVTGKRVRVEVGFDTFCIEDLEDTANEPTIIQLGGRANHAKFVEWFKQSRKALVTMDFDGVITSLRANEIEFHQYFAMD